MKLERAFEIFNSLGIIDVEYKNRSIWIEAINKETNTANVRDLETNNLNEVPVNELNESK